MQPVFTSPKTRGESREKDGFQTAHKIIALLSVIAERKIFILQSQLLCGEMAVEKTGKEVSTKTPTIYFKGDLTSY